MALLVWRFRRSPCGALGLIAAVEHRPPAMGAILSLLTCPKAANASVGASMPQNAATLFTKIGFCAQVNVYVVLPCRTRILSSLRDAIPAAERCQKYSFKQRLDNGVEHRPKFTDRLRSAYVAFRKAYLKYTRMAARTPSQMGTVALMCLFGL